MSARTDGRPRWQNGIAECHVRCITESLRALFDSGARSMSVTSEALDADTRGPRLEDHSFT